MLSPLLYPTQTTASTWPFIIPTVTATNPSMIGSIAVYSVFDNTGYLYYHNLTSSVTSHAPPWPAIVPPALNAGSVRLARPRLVADPELSLERSIALFRRFRPEHEIRAFLAGNPIRVQGYHYDYHVKKTVDPLTHTRDPSWFHVPYDLRLVRKDGRVLAKGCVVVPDTPVIDQLLALILHVKDRAEEVNLLMTTNWTPRPAELSLIH